MRKPRIIVIIILIITAILGGVAIWIGLRLGKEDEVTPEESEAASEEVWNAERSDLTEYAGNWQTVIDEANFDFDKAKTYALSDDGARFKSTAEILVVDGETLYGRDLNYYLMIHKFRYYISSDPLPENELDYVLDILMTDSILLQEASEAGIITLDSEVYNSETKDLKKRNILCTQAREALSDQLVQKVSFEYITIWFHNAEVPVSIDSGKALAEQKINALYERLQSGEITMEQAGSEIKSDTEIGESIDPAYKNNAYGKAEAWEKSKAYFLDSNVEQSLWALGDGQMSTVVTGRDMSSSDLYDAYYIIIFTSERSHGITDSSAYQSTDEMLEDKLEDSKSVSDIKVKE